MDDRALRSANRAALALAALLLAALPARAERERVTPIPVERERPGKSVPSRENRGRGGSPGKAEARALARDLDPRFLEYRRLLSEIAAGKDSVTLDYDARERAGLYTSVADLARLETELDQMERLLDLQRTRLAILQDDFAGRQRTELDLLVTGGTLAGQVDSVRVTLEDGTSVVSSVNDTQRSSLAHGGVLEVFRGLVQPREQVVEVALMGEGWSSTGHGFITLTPGRDRLTFLKLDLSQAKPVLGIASVVAGTWQLDPGQPSAEATRDRP